MRSHGWRALIEQLPLAVYIDRLDEWSSNVYTSPQLEAILGYTTEEWASDDRHLLKILHPDDRERVMEAHNRSRETGEPFREEYRLIARDGRVVWFLDQATVLPGDAGMPALHQGFYLDITERKELEEALAARTEELGRQKRYFESLLEISPVAIVTTDLEDVVTSWNPAAERLFGYTPAEAHGRKIDDLVAKSPELRAEATSVTRDAYTEGRVQAFTKRTHKDGSLIDVELLAAPVLLRGEPVGTYAIYHDVRKRKRAEEALRESEQRFRVMFEEAPIGVAWGPLDVSTMLVPTFLRRPGGEGEFRWNRAYREMLGYSEDELQTLHPSEYTHPEDRPRQLALYRDLVAGKADRYELEMRYIGRDGRTIWAQVVDSIVRDDQGEALFGLTMVEDITQRKLAEEALRQSESEVRRQKQYFESLVELSPTAIVTVDLDGNVTSWNPAAEKLFGYDRQEAIGRDVDDLVARSDAVRAEAIDAAYSARKGEDLHITTQRTRKDGSLVDVDVRGAPIFVGEQHVGYYALYHDISDLLQARRDAEAAAEAKSAFL
ncbi:MAG TPA: PAS domain S-box protein, partial [Thermoleophilaceae bacterium]